MVPQHESVSSVDLANHRTPTSSGSDNAWRVWAFLPMVYAFTAFNASGALSGMPAWMVRMAAVLALVAALRIAATRKQRIFPVDQARIRLWWVLSIVVSGGARFAAFGPSLKEIGYLTFLLAIPFLTDLVTESAAEEKAPDVGLARTTRWLG